MLTKWLFDRGCIELACCVPSGEIRDTTDDIYGSIGDGPSPNEAMYTGLSDGEIQVMVH